MVRIGIVGTGYRIGIAKMHIAGYKTLTDVEITALYDEDRLSCEEYKQRFQLNEATVCSSLEELFDLVDAVSICTPNNTHIEIAKKALEHDVHVLCEKPFSNTLEGTENLVELANASRKVDMIGLC